MDPFSEMILELDPKQKSDLAFLADQPVEGEFLVSVHGFSQRSYALLFHPFSFRRVLKIVFRFSADWHQPSTVRQRCK